MTREQYDDLVHRLEADAARKPAGYRFRVLLLALLGYAYVIGVLAAVVVLAAAVVILSFRWHLGILAGKLGLPLLVLAGIVLRSLWVRLPSPEGLRLDRGQVPELFAELDLLRAALRTPAIHRVLLIPDCNAAMVQIPRLGVLGWQRNHLLLGLPLLQALPPDGFRAVVAHELGHLSRAHGRFSTWIYRVRQTWDRLLAKVEEEHQASLFLFRRFFEWYSPYFSAYSFVLARRHEYEADRHAADVAGAAAAADALVRVNLLGDYLERDFWPGFFRRAQSQAAPPEEGLRELGEAIARAPLGSAADRLEKALRVSTDMQDTHPALRDRLAALGLSPSLPGPVPETSARRYLGAALPALTRELSRSWSEAVAPAWQSRHEESKGERARLAELESKAVEDGLEPAEEFERAWLIQKERGEDAALPLYRALLDRDPDHAAAAYAYGSLLLDRDDEEGARWIDKALEQEPGFALLAARALAAYWRSRGEEAKARPYEERLERAVAEVQAARRERSIVSAGDDFLEHGLEPADVQSIAGQLAACPQVRAAWLARKRLALSPEPLYVLILQLGVHFRSEGYHQKLCQKIAREVAFPGETFIFSDVIDRKLRASVVKAPGSEIYRRS